MPAAHGRARSPPRRPPRADTSAPSPSHHRPGPPPYAAAAVSPPAQPNGVSWRTPAVELRPVEHGRGRSEGQQRVTVDDSGSGTDAQGGVEPPPLPASHERGDPPPADTGEDPLALRVEQLILGAERRYTPFQAARSAGVTMELATRFWRAMGFADVGQAKALTEADVLALRRLAGLVEAGLLSEAMAVQVARSTGQTTARLAEWQMDSFLEGLTEPPEPGMTRTEVTYPIVELLLPELQEFLVYVWRRQLAASAGRVVQGADDEEMVDRRLAVAFADLVGFTRLTRRMEEEELGELVEAFETTAADLVAARGGRLIKTLGDEVLYVADDAGTAAEIALMLIETLANDETMPELRVG
ncbi:adenylate cyclase, partial [Streptomyces viridosporus ATCC 14672]